MKPHHVLISIMLLMTVAALHKYSDNQRIEAAYKERNVALAEKIKLHCPVTWRTVLKTLDVKDCR